MSSKMSASGDSGRLGETPEGSVEIPRESILKELSLPGRWEVVADPLSDDLLLVKDRGQSRWQSISLSISHRKNGDKIQGRYRKAPYRRGRVGDDPVERKTFDMWSDAVDWIQDQL